MTCHDEIQKMFRIHAKQMRVIETLQLLEYQYKINNL